jgi:hypothetical protein
MCLPWKDGIAPLPIKERPQCHYCGKRLEPLTIAHYERRDTPLGFTQAPVYRRLYGYGSQGDGHFCGQLHGYLWALYTVRKIQERKAKPKAAKTP